MKKLLGLCLCMALLLTGCGRTAPPKAADGASWSEDWVTLGRVIGVDTPEGLTPRENSDVLSTKGMYYATWSAGEAVPYVNEDGEDAQLYDAQVYLLAAGYDSTQKAEETAAEWLAMAGEQYAVEETKEDYREYIESWVHEIKAPITSVALMCENHRSEVTRNIGTENGKIENYVDMALYYARSDEVYRDYLIQETDLGAVAAEVVGRGKYYFIQNAVQVAIDCGDPVYTDQKWIAFILNQILQNSLKYRRETGARIRIYTQKEKRGVRLIVEDNGIGIKAEELPRIFEKNFTGTNGRNHERSTGMGLYLCGKLCAKLGIGIRAESEEHVGTKVVLEFPISTYIRAEGN